MDKIYHFSAPGRTELGGNHTDHQHGCVLAAAIDLEMTAKVSLNGTGTIRVCSQGYTPFEIQLSQLTCREDEKALPPPWCGVWPLNFRPWVQS